MNKNVDIFAQGGIHFGTLIQNITTITPPHEGVITTHKERTNLTDTVISSSIGLGTKLTIAPNVAVEVQGQYLHALNSVVKDLGYPIRYQGFDVMVKLGFLL